MTPIVGEPPANAVARQGRIVERVRPILAGEHPAVVGAALAELVAILLAGHQGEPEQEAAALREELLQLHVKTARALLPIAVAERRMRAGLAP